MLYQYIKYLSVILTVLIELTLGHATLSDKKSLELDDGPSSSANTYTINGEFPIYSHSNAQPVQNIPGHYSKIINGKILYYTNNNANELDQI